MKRFLSLALMIAIASVGSFVSKPAYAESGAEREFTLEVFPHPSGDVTFRDTWGARRSGGRRHAGIDILSPRGTPIVAVASGVVIFMGEQRLSGYVMKIDHGEGWSTVYMHLNNDDPGTDNGEGGELGAFAPGLYEGAAVEAGQLIGWVGDSGNAEHTTPHTHFELKHDDQKLNPFPYLEKAWLWSGREASSSALIMAI
jgi:murein DD-endopeptidase MepM/ murein hydrolase activator NlpD